MDDPIDGEIDGGEEDGALAPVSEDKPARGRGSAVLGVPIEVVVSVGRARPMIAELVTLRRDSVLPLDSRIEDPVELFIGERLIARGELQEMDDDSGRLAVRLTEVADLSGGV